MSKRKRTAPDLSLRNVRAAATRDKHLRAHLATLIAVVEALERRVDVLEGRRASAPATDPLTALAAALTASGTRLEFSGDEGA